MESKLYTVLEVCEILKVSRRTLYRYMELGQLTGIKVGSQWRFTEAQIQDFLNPEK